MKECVKHAVVLGSILLFSSTASALAAPFNSRQFAVEFLARINQLLRVQILLDIRHADSMSGATPYGGNGQVHFADIDLDGYDQRPYGEHTESALAFLLAHEATHNLVNHPVSTESIPTPPGFKKHLRTHLKLQRKYIMLGTELEHENVDAFAAKLIRHFGYPIDGAIIGLIDAPNRYGPQKNEVMLKKLMLERARLIKIAYSEGWSDWQLYNPLTSPCAIYAQNVYEFFQSQRATKILSRIGPAPCAYFPLETFVETMLGAVPRFHSIYD